MVDIDLLYSELAKAEYQMDILCENLYLSDEDYGYIHQLQRKIDNILEQMDYLNQPLVNEISPATYEGDL